LLQNKFLNNRIYKSRLRPAFLVLVLLCSCSLFKGENEDKKLELTGYEKYETEDFSSHLASFERSFLNTPEIKELKLREYRSKYIYDLINKIINKNKIFFSKKTRPKFFIIKDDTPYHFSLPNRKIFLSSGLFKKYVQNESLLICVLTFELIRTEKEIYKKTMIIPTGNLDSKRLLPLLRLNALQKMKIHKWAFRLLKKLEIDSDTYLSWLQIQNRNSIDFSMQLGDINVISREEALFKEFVIENSRGERKRKYKRSTKAFYSFLRYVRNNS
jgi:hypothetical protein